MKFKTKPLFSNFLTKPKVIPPTTPIPEIPKSDWREKYAKVEPNKPYKLEDSTDDSELNRAIQLKTFDNTKQIEGKPGKLYYDKTNKKVKIFISEADGWKDLDYS